jgi:hypothetical protein
MTLNTTPLGRLNGVEVKFHTSASSVVRDTGNEFWVATGWTSFIAVSDVKVRGEFVPERIVSQQNPQLMISFTDIYNSIFQ